MRTVTLLLTIIPFFSHLYAKEITTKCIAHRGNNKYHLENSISSVKSAAAVESDGVEIDVRHTKDGHAILMHDSTLSRVAKSRPGKTCPLEEKVKNLNIIDIRTNCLLKNNENIPLLIEALESISLSSIDWFIELKDSPNQNTIEIINSYIPEFQSKKIISFRRKILKKTKAFFKKIENMSSIELFKLYRFYWFHQKEFHADVKFTKFNLKKLLNNKEKVKKAIWTIDGSKKLERALKLNVDYVTTNDPELCLFLKGRINKILRADNYLSTI